MGVNRTDYLMLGVDMGAADFDRDSFEAECDGAPNRRFDIIYDGMSGQYCIAGKVISKSDPYDGIEMRKINPESLDIDRTALANAISDAFERPVLDDELYLILFSHFS